MSIRTYWIDAGIDDVRRFVWRDDVLAVLGYTILALLFTWPLLTRIDTHVIGPYKTDNFEYLWKMWWVPEAVFERHISPFFVPHIYYPQGYQLAFGEMTPFHSFLLMPLTMLTNEVITYNVTLLFSAILSGWLTYRLARRWLSSLAGDDALLLFGAAFFAGAAFAFSVYRVQKGIGGHVPLFQTQWIVLALLGLDRWLDSRRRRDAAISALGISLGALSSWYYLFIPAMILPIYFLRSMTDLPALLRDKRTWWAVGVVIIIMAVLVAPFMLPYRELEAGASEIPLDQASFWAASPTDYIISNPGHPVWGDALQNIVWPASGEMPLEFMVPALDLITLIVGLWAWRKLEGRRWRALKWCIVAAFILSLGPVLHLWRLPLGIPLPAMLLREVIPGADGLRSWGRFSLFVTLGMSLITAGGLVLLLRERSLNMRVGLVAAALAVMLFINWGGKADLVAAKPRLVDQWLNTQAGDFSVMQYPLGAATNGSSLFYSRFHDQPVVYGASTFFFFFYQDENPDLLDFPHDNALDLLESWDVRYIMVQTDSLDDEDFSLADIDAQPRLQHVITLDNQAVYELQSA